MDESTRRGKGLWRQFDFIVVAVIVLLAVLLGVLNNLRVADERKAKWFGAPDESSGAEAQTEAIQ